MVLSFEFTDLRVRVVVGVILLVWGWWSDGRDDG